MPLQKSGSDEALHSNIKEMIKSGYGHKQAVAAALANQRKYKKMAMGGVVSDSELLAQPKESLAEAIMEPNDSGLEVNGRDEDDEIDSGAATQAMAQGGEVSSGLSEEAKTAIMNRKKNRKFVQRVD